MNRKLVLGIISVFMLLPFHMVAQNVAINTTGAVGAASAMLDVSSTNSGMLIPRVALTATNVAAPVAVPATSLLVYNTATAGAGSTAVVPSFYYWDGTQWVRLQAGNSNNWNLLGNAGTSPATNFLGTTDNQSLVFRTNNAERVRVLNTGEVGIGTPTPIQNLDVNGRINVQNGVIQRGTTAITATTDLGLYQQNAGNWIRIATNASPIKFFVDQGGANSGGTNAVMAVDNANGGGVMIAAEITGTGNAGSPFSRAALELNSTTKGMLTTRMTTAQRDAMGGGLAEGLLIYNIDNNCFEYWDTQSNPLGLGGFWNSLCDHCDNIVIISANQTGFNLNTYVGGGRAETYCVYVQAGYTLQAAGNGGGSGAAGNSGFNASTMPSGAKIILYNYGNILAGGGNGGLGGREVDGVCAGADANGQAGGAGGHAIFTSATVPITVFNYGTLRAGGGGGGGGGWGCCAAGGGGGGGAGTPVGVGGGGNTTNCISGFTCGCNGSTSTGGNVGTALTGGAGGAGVNRPPTGCPTCNGTGAGAGGAGGANGVAGGAGISGNNGAGGAAGFAVQGSGSGSTLSNFGTVAGGVNP